MSRYRITVEGKTYEVQIESVEEQPVSEDCSVHKNYNTKSFDPVVRVINSDVEKKTIIQSGIVRSPIPGTILSVNVSVGDQIRKGQLIILLEAMKMNNEICSPSDGRITAIHVAQGDTVQGGDILFEVGE